MDKLELLETLESSALAMSVNIADLEKHIDILKENLKLLQTKIDNTRFELEEEQEEKTNEMARELIKQDKKIIQLRNGQVGIYFSDKLDLSEYGIPEDSIIEFDDNIPGLEWDRTDNKFHGTPIELGEFKGKITINQSLKDEDYQNDTVEKEIHFLVNPDPRSLWKNIDPPHDDIYFKENSDFYSEKINDKNLIGISMRGKSHAHKGTFRDDHFLNKIYEDSSWVLQIVADGAGSSKYSRKASEIACHTVEKHISEFINSDKLSEFEEQINLLDSDADKEQLSQTVYELTAAVAYKALEAIKAEAIETANSIKDYSTTLLFTLSKKIEIGTIVIKFSVGDGAIAIVREDNTELLMTPDEGNFSGQTLFLNSPEVLSNDSVYERCGLHWFEKDVKALVLMTDGISDPKFGSNKDLKDSESWKNFLNELYPLAEGEEIDKTKWMNWIDFYMKGEYDDRTISILY
ncbi:MAG: protein phosphatase 2C domain-containing protein [Marinifilaceae bacterium]|jgi:serine/threonine protein phosphatase PrpC|nr:protein phosphatase 2C domain-containing protein [Marinifilaceae bacterium]